ncbi:hypothetical protein ACJIZ3_008722 [Penstemon smallii]|uniref:Uncharacterized protein n=1 Tax=Penstemon smallii TaxID=265156 RepID=A0ABD3TBK1_9LAMI
MFENFVLCYCRFIKPTKLHF